jgi:hypothetical protein
MIVKFEIEEHEIKEAIRLYLNKRTNLNLSQDFKIEFMENQKVKITGEIQNKTQESLREQQPKER